MPIYAKVDLRECDGRGLGEAVLLVRVAGGHEEGGVKLKTPGATLNGSRGRELGEVAGVEIKR